MKLPDAFTPAQQAVLGELHERDARERRAGIREAKSLKAVSPAVAQLLHLLVLHRGARQIAEFGTSHGYSTIHLAAAAERTRGRVYTVDAMPEKTAHAAANLEAAGLLHRVTLATGDGADFAASLPPEIDFVLVDYGVDAFAPAFDALRRHLAGGCLLFFDGGPEGYWDSPGVRDFRSRLEEDPDLVVSLLPMEKEQLLAVRLPR